MKAQSRKIFYRCKKIFYHGGICVTDYNDIKFANPADLSIYD